MVDKIPHLYVFTACESQENYFFIMKYNIDA